MAYRQKKKYFPAIPIDIDVHGLDNNLSVTSTMLDNTVVGYISGTLFVTVRTPNVAVGQVSATGTVTVQVIGYEPGLLSQPLADVDVPLYTTTFPVTQNATVYRMSLTLRDIPSLWAVRVINSCGVRMSYNQPKAAGVIFAGSKFDILYEFEHEPSGGLVGTIESRHPIMYGAGGGLGVRSNPIYYDVTPKEFNNAGGRTYLTGLSTELKVGTRYPAGGKAGLSGRAAVQVSRLPQFGTGKVSLSGAADATYFVRP